MFTVPYALTSQPPPFQAGVADLCLQSPFLGFCNQAVPIRSQTSLLLPSHQPPLLPYYQLHSTVQVPTLISSVPQAIVPTLGLHGIARTRASKSGQTVHRPYIMV